MKIYKLISFSNIISTVVVEILLFDTLVKRALLLDIFDDVF